MYLSVLDTNEISLDIEPIIHVNDSISTHPLEQVNSTAAATGIEECPRGGEAVVPSP